MPDNPRLSRSAAPAVQTGIVHLGPGAFFRAFNAVYTAEAMAATPADWGITAVSLRSPDIRDRLMPQGCAYTSVTLTPDGPEYQMVEAINEVLVAPEDPAAVLARMSDPAVKIVSLTVTEKGYCHNPATGQLRLDDPDIQHDLAHPNAPKTAPGFLVFALARRRAKGLAPFTVLPCDNLPDNGALTRNVVLDFARALDAEVDGDLAEWIDGHARFPATMVDRITPATTEADIASVAEATGFDDQACVMHEPFRQWVIQDDFVGGARPAWNAGGAQFVQDVAAFETMKLRCLNGTHSTLAYLGYLAGYETISDTVADPAFAKLIDDLWQTEIIPTVPQPEGEDLVAYCASLKARYLNPSIRHRTWQIAMDGSQKLPQRLLGTIRDNLDAGRPVPRLALAVAGWMRYVGGVDETGAPIEVKDPMAATLRAAFDAGGSPAEKVENLLAIRDIFDAELAEHSEFRTAVENAFYALMRQGVLRTLRTL